MVVSFLAHPCRTLVGWDGDFSVIKPKHFGGREIASRPRILGGFFGGGEIAPQAPHLALTRTSWLPQSVAVKSWRRL